MPSRIGTPASNVKASTSGANRSSAVPNEEGQLTHCTLALGGVRTQCDQERASGTHLLRVRADVHDAAARRRFLGREGQQVAHE
jgi:hypothetical protein